MRSRSASAISGPERPQHCYMRRTRFRRRKTNRHVPWIMGLGSLAMAFWLFSFMNWWQFLVGLLFLAFGWASVKTALFASDVVPPRKLERVPPSGGRPSSLVPRRSAQQARPPRTVQVSAPTMARLPPPSLPMLPRRWRPLESVQGVEVGTAESRDRPDRWDAGRRGGHWGRRA